jgi:hypothetical protein
MARGWESKSVESQIEDRRNEGTPERGRVDPVERERTQKRESLEMSRRRVSRELEGARSDTHRSALQHALRHLDDELGKL